MRKFIAALLLLSGLVLAGVAYSCYWDYYIAGNVARYYRTHPDEVPTGTGHESREQYITGEEMAADRNRNLTVLSGAGSLLLCLGGTVSLIRAVRGKKETASVASPNGGLNEDTRLHSEAMSRWASDALARPLEVRVGRLHVISLWFLLIFSPGLGALTLIANGLTSTTLVLLVPYSLIFLLIFYLVSAAQRKSASLFDLFGVIRRDNRRFNWSEFRGVVYVIKKRNRAYLWRVELDFDGGKVWLIPQKIRNWDEIESLINTLPCTPQRRMV